MVVDFTAAWRAAAPRGVLRRFVGPKIRQLERNVEFAVRSVHAHVRACVDLPSDVSIRTRSFSGVTSVAAALRCAAYTTATSSSIAAALFDDVYNVLERPVRKATLDVLDSVSEVIRE